jgi:uncharacterized protein (TIGR02145 family)
LFCGGIGHNAYYYGCENTKKSATQAFDQGVLLSGSQYNSHIGVIWSKLIKQLTLMKKLFTLLMLAFAMVAMVACNKDNDDTTEWVDLGLPSGLLWAKCNLGADTPEKYGNYYAWGEVATKEQYNWSTYRYCTVFGADSLQTLTKYNLNSDYGTVDDLTTLQAVDDAATVALGNGARIPTKGEWEELINNTTNEWTTVNRVHGLMLTASNGNNLFLPAAGSFNDMELIVPEIYGFYWSASLYTDYSDDAWSFSFVSDEYRIGSFGYRSDGQSVRSVRSK